MVFSKGMEGIVGGGATEEVAEKPGHYHFGTNALSVPREGMEVRPIMTNGLVSDWDSLSKLLSHTFIERLQIEPKEHPILLSEPSFNTSVLREKSTELLFEEHGVPALFLAKSAVLSSFAHGRATSVVLESGAGMTAAVPVHDGYVLTKAIVKSQLAGDELTRIYEHVIRSSGNALRPNFSLVKKKIGDNDYSVSEKQLNGVTHSFHQYHVHQLVQDIKESTTKVSEADFDADAPVPAGDTTTYQLPDQTVYTPGIWRYRMPEILFNPAAHIPETYAGHETLSTLPGVHQMMYRAINACDTDLKKDLYQNIFITGGNTLWSGFNDRFMSELSSLFGAQIKLKNQSLPTAAERKNSCFIGGSILGSLGTFHQMWMSKQEYEEHGKGLVDRKCP